MWPQSLSGNDPRRYLTHRPWKTSVRLGGFGEIPPPLGGLGEAAVGNADACEVQARNGQTNAVWP